MRRRELLLLMAGAAGATVASFDVNGQHLSTYRVAYLALAAGEHAALMKPFVERLRERGLVQGQNLTVIYRSADGNAERLSQLADELVRTKPDVLVAGQGTLTALAASEQRNPFRSCSRLSVTRSDRAWCQVLLGLEET